MIRRAFDLEAKVPFPKALDEAFGDTEEILVSALAAEVFGNPRALKRTMNRLLLLVETPQWTEFIGTAGAARDRVKKNIVKWVAGAERFRSFRHFVYTATDEEVAAVVSAAHGAATAGGPDGSASRSIAATPGLAQFLTEIGLTAAQMRLAEAVGKELRPGRGDKRPNLGDIDALLRSVGL